MVEANGDAAVRAFVRTQTFGKIASAMIETDEDHAIAAFSLALHYTGDRFLKACSDILFDKRDTRHELKKLRSQAETAPAVPAG
jgi:hypothetical protein